MPLAVADLFCGTGGLSKGFSNAGDFEVVLGVDIRQSSIKTFSANHPRALAICNDIRQIQVHDVLDRLGRAVDVVVAGPPCQGFSSIRPYRSITEDDTRNNLFEQLLVFVKHLQPQFVVFENVVGLLRHKRGEVLCDIRDGFASLGYATTMAVLNAVNFGVPQKRERVIVLGKRGSVAPALPEATHFFDGRGMASRDVTHLPLPLFTDELAPAVTVDQAIGDLPLVPAGGSASEYDVSRGASAYARERRNGEKTLTLHASTAHSPRMLEIIRRAGTNRWALPEGLTTSGFSSCYSRLTADEPSTTITVNFVHPASNRCIHPTQDRALTPREGARLQGFDDSFVFCGSRTEVVKQIGEAVPPLLGGAIARTIAAQAD